MKKILMVLTVLVSTLILSGCGNETRTAITADEFYNRVNSDYVLSDITYKMGYVKKAYIYDKDGLLFYFYEGNRSFDMGNIYIDEVENVASNMLNKEDEIVKGSNFSSITIKNDKEYYRIAYVDNTLLYAKTDLANKAKVDDVFKRAGY